MRKAYFILSTGRCGTQWISDYLQRTCGDHFIVAHEPLHNGYDPRRMLGFRDPIEMEAALTAPAIEHFRKIATLLEAHHYIECGHPCWSVIPYCVHRFQGRVGVIHLVRHPVQTAFSWMTHRAYCPPILPYLKEKVLLSPFDKGVCFHRYGEKWDRLTPYEKALFYWAEVNTFGLALENRSNIPWLRLKFEDLFTGGGVKRLTHFLGIGVGETTFCENRVDQYRWGTEHWYDWRLIHHHPEILALAEQFDYQVKDIDEVRLYERYVLMRQQ